MDARHGSRYAHAIPCMIFMTLRKEALTREPSVIRRTPATALAR